MMSRPRGAAVAAPPRRRVALVAALLLFLLLLAGRTEPAYAGPMETVFTKVGEFQGKMEQRVADVVKSPTYKRYTHVLFFVLGMSLIVMKCTRWGLRGFSFGELFETIMQLLMVSLLLTSFATICPVLFNGGVSVARATLAALTGATPELVAGANLPTKLVAMFHTYAEHIKPACNVQVSADVNLNVLDGVNAFDPSTYGNVVENVNDNVEGIADGVTDAVRNAGSILDCVQNGHVKLVAAVLMGIVVVLLCVAIMAVHLWGFWLYGIAMVLGPVFIPCMLYERLEFLFEGWLKFFFGSVVYVILAHVNLGLLAVAVFGVLRSSVEGFDTVFGSEVVALLSGNAVRLRPDAPLLSILDVLDKFAVFSLGLAALASTGRFAKIVVAGATGHA